MDKDFDRWNRRKKRINASPKNLSFMEGQIWWCSAGLNVGHEIDGKHGTYERPFYIIKKCNSKMFIGVPCTTNMEHGSYAYALNITDGNFMLNFSQVKSMSVKRLLRRMTNIPEPIEERIKKSFLRYINRKPAD